MCPSRLTAYRAHLATVYARHHFLYPSSNQLTSWSLGVSKLCMLGCSQKGWASDGPSVSSTKEEGQCSVQPTIFKSPRMWFYADGADPLKLEGSLRITGLF